LSEIATTDQNVDEDCSLDTFEIITSIRGPAKELVDKELLIFTKFQVDAKDIKCPLQWCNKHESMFPIVRFLAR
jgi:hypothetical protein